MPDNDMGDPKNITGKTFDEAARAMGQPIDEVTASTLERLQQNAEEVGVPRQHAVAELLLTIHPKSRRAFVVRPSVRRKFVL